MPAGLNRGIDGRSEPNTPSLRLASPTTTPSAPPTASLCIMCSADGVDATLDGGYIVTCGDGPETTPKWMKDCHEKTWTAFVYRADGLGQPLWTANVTDAADR